ncbi:hypothetical protein U9M48_026812, partial [Paspalum notatum var. saurae]
MGSKSSNGECTDQVPRIRSKSSNDDESGSADEMPGALSKSSSDDNIECADRRGSPRAVLDISVSGSVDSDDSASDEQSARSNHNVQWRNLIGGLILRRKKSMGRAVTAIAPEILPEIGKWRPSWRSFDYEELCAATDRFSPAHVNHPNAARLLGWGSVWKGACTWFFSSHLMEALLLFCV